VNGEPTAVPSACTVSALLAQLGWADRRVAVEVNGEIVPRSRHAQHTFNEQDRVEIVFAIGGGRWP
jgi:sulfur carrier protein